MIKNLPEKICPLPTKVSTAIATIQKKNLQPETSLAHWQRRTMEARLALLNHIERLIVAASVNKAVDRIVTLAKAGELPEHLQQLVPIANARSGGDLGKQTLSRRTLFRWRSDLQNLGMSKRPKAAWGPEKSKASNLSADAIPETFCLAIFTLLMATVLMPKSHPRIAVDLSVRRSP